MPDTRFTPETARAAAEKASVRRAELARLRREDPEALIREKFSAKTAELGDELLAAALGTGHWADLPLDKRLTALAKALEYAVGRPTPRKPPSDKPEEDGRGLTIE